MKFHSVRLCVDDVGACYRFYRDVLKLEPAFEGEGSVYAEFKLGETAITLFARDMMAEAIGASPSGARAMESVVIVLESDGPVDAMLETLRSRGARVVHEPTDQQMWGLRVAHIADPAGNLIEIYQDLAPTQIA